MMHRKNSVIIVPAKDTDFPTTRAGPPCPLFSSLVSAGSPTTSGVLASPASVALAMSAGSTFPPRSGQTVLGRKIVPFSYPGPIHPSIYPYIHPSIHLSVHPSIHSSIRISRYPLIHLLMSSYCAKNIMYNIDTTAEETNDDEQDVSTACSRKSFFPASFLNRKPPFVSQKSKHTLRDFTTHPLTLGRRNLMALAK